MDLVTGAIESLIPKLRLLLHQEYNLPTAVKRDVANLYRELKFFDAVLRELAEVPSDKLNEHVRTWGREMREASYNMEDIIDTVMVSADGCREPINMGGWLKRARKKMSDLPNKAKGRGDIVAAIENIKKQFYEIAKRHSRYRVDDVAVTAISTTADPRLPALYRNGRELVGIEEPREELVRLLTQGDSADDKKREVKVVSIVGLGGVGKTTLAKAVYNRLQEQFDCSAFVTVSRNPDLKEVFKDILLELDEANYPTVITTKRGMDESQFINEIREFLENKRCLIVIDDIWDVSTWERIRLALSDAGNGSRIITTSRIFDVAAKGGGAITYRLNPLSHVNSVKLFYKRIFGGEGNCPDIKLAEVSDKILKECSGLPLAIITVASVLASKPRNEWSQVYNSIALRHESNRYVDNMRTVLSFSFYYLPYHLRACLLHLSIFPENCLIEKDFLIWKWVAEGFAHLESEGYRNKFEFGESCFNDLVNRSTIQIAEECLNKGRVHCRVHPVLFSQIRAISTEENFCTVLEDEHHILPGNINPRRIGMHSIRNVEHNIEAVANISIEKVRSFNASLCFIDWIPPLSSFQVLRVLALDYCPGMSSNHLKMIGKLVHLRYLGLVGAGVLELPEETLRGLRFLQTLDLRETDIEQWPRTIFNLQQLMCLCVHRTRAISEGMMGTLAETELEDLRLHLISGDSSKFMAELGRLLCLRVLVLGFEKIDVELEKALLESLRKLHKIQRLEIYCEQSTRAVAWEDSRWAPAPGIRQLVVGGLMFSRLPSWINESSLPNLCRLHLGLVIMEDGDLETLGTFPELRSLLLMVDASDEQEHHITTVVGSSDHAFNKLNFFSTNMAVRFESGLGGPLMPNLEHVELHVSVAQCADSRLSSLAHLKSLEKVTVALDGRGASAAETEEAEEKLRAATSVHPNRRLRLEVTKQTGNDEVPLVEQFRFKDPRFEALRSEMEKMQANRQVQVQPDSDSNEEITPAKVVSE